MKEKTFTIQGLDCAEEVKALKKTVGVLAGVDDLRFDVLNARMTVVFSAESVADKDIQTAVENAGMKIIPDDAVDGRTVWQRNGILISCIISGLFLFAGFTVHAILHGSILDSLIGAGHDAGHKIPTAAIVLYLVSIISGGWFIAPKAFFALRSKRADMNLLMTVAVIGASVIGEWFEAAAVTFLFALSLVLESWSVGRARRAIGKLMNLAPETARYICPHDGDIMEKPVADVPVGVTVLVRPGEKVPLDGVISKGTTSINQAPITGESVPVEKKEGDEVFAGTINEESAFQFTVTKDASNSTLARIIRMVEDAQGRRARTEQWVEKFAYYYTPAMMIISVMVAVLPPLFLGDWSRWFYEALVMLVIACPCALVISTPVTIVAGLASAARAGVLIKGGIFLEIPARLQAVALDKTGTLTCGMPEVQEIYPFNGHTKDDVLARAASIEHESGHPIARAIVRAAETRGLKLDIADNIVDIKGKGAEARIDNKKYWIGSHRFMHEKAAETTEIHDKAIEIEDAAHTLVALGSDSHVCGLLAVADSVRDTAFASVGKMKEVGIRHIVMLTGDNEKTASEVAKLTGISEFRAELLPHEKVEAIEQLRKDYEVVAMIGDGVNDAPAMAVSSLAIAMGAVGTDTAIETADIALMSDDLSKVPWLIKHSRRTLAIIKQNIIFALVIKAVFMVLALMGIATLWMAIMADTGASLIVIFNGLRMLRSSPSFPIRDVKSYID